MNVFLSYSRSELQFAEDLRERLRDWGYTPWMDIHDIPKSAYWPDAIDQALQSADVVVGVLSPRSVASRSVKNEWDWCLVYGKWLILLRYEPGYVPLNYVSLNYIDCSGERYETGLSDLRQSLATGRAVGAVRRFDAYEGYLRALYERVNRFIGQKIFPALLNHQGEPEPLRLAARSRTDAVDALFAKREELDPLFIAAGLEVGSAAGACFADVWSAFEHFDRRLLLLGAPGAGKTFTLLHACRDATVRRLGDPSAPLPVLGIVPTWDANEQPSLEEWLGRSYGAPPDVARVIKDGRAMLLLDGLDELGEPRGGTDPRAEFLRALPANNEILITSREADYAQIRRKAKLAGAVTLLPLTDAQIRQAVARQPKLAAVIESDPLLREALRTPLLLSLLASASGGVDEEIPETFTRAGGVPELRDRILRAYLVRRYQHEASKWSLSSPPPFVYTLEEVYEVLGNACLYSSNDLGRPHESGYGESVLPAHRIGSAYQGLMLVERKSTWTGEEGLQVREEARHFIDFARSLNLLVEVGVMFDEPLYATIHKMFFDHFAFTYALKHVENPNHYRDIMSDKPTTYLGRSGDRRAVGPLIRALESGGNVYMRFSAASALERLGDPSAVEPLIRALRDKDAMVRIHAAEALGALGDPRAVEPLRERLKDWDEGYFRLVCNAAAYALEKIGTREALAYLREARRKEWLKEDPPWDW